MLNQSELSEIARALADEWGEDAVEKDEAENKVYIQFIDDVVVSLAIDCNLGVSHCVADLPNVFPASMAPKTFEDQCVYANRLNIMLTRELGATHAFQVLDDRLKLTETRTFTGPQDIVAICDAQARDTMSFMSVVTQSLMQLSDDTNQDAAEMPQNAIFA